jgi:uncharacterized cupin superfamily protein
LTTLDRLETSMTIHLDPSALTAGELEAKELAPPSATPLAGPITVRSRTVFVSDDKKVISGIWECEPGASRWEFDSRGEIIHILSGRMSCAEDGGEPVEVGPGSMAVFPIGWHGVWTVHETLRKVFVVYK